MHDHDHYRVSEEHWQSATPDERVDRRQRAFRAHATRFGTIAMICLVIWAVTGFGSMWPLWVIAIGGIRLGLQARHAYGNILERGDSEQDYAAV